MTGTNENNLGYFDYNPRAENELEQTSSYSSTFTLTDTDEETKFPGKAVIRDRCDTEDPVLIKSPPELRRANTDAQRPRLVQRLMSAQSVTNRQRPNHLIRENSVFEKQSLANVRLEEAMGKQKKSNSSIWLVVATAALTYGLHGVSNSITNGIITDKTFIEQFPQTDDTNTSGALKSHNSTIQGVTVGMYQIGCALGALACYFLNDKFGRKPTIHILGIFSCIGIILQTTSYSLIQMIIGRIVLGLGIGAGHATFPIYLAESVPSRIRGRAIIICAATGNFGHFYGAVIEIAFYFVRNSPQWRIPLILEILWAGASAVLPFWCPESPRFLLSKGRYEECVESQSKLSGLPHDHPVVIEEVNALESALHEAHADKDDARPPARRFYRAFLAVFIQIMSSMCGIDVVSFFSTQTFHNQLHFSRLISRILTMGLQACQWLFSTLAIFAIDSMGRRPLLLYCAALMVIAMGGLYGLSGASATAPMLKSAILFYFFTMCAYPVGYHLIPSMYVAELSPGNTRDQISAITGCLHFLFDFLVTLITPVALTSIGSSYYLVYMSTNILTFAVIYLCFPETKGLELETIDESFELAPSHLKIVPYAAERAALARQLVLDLENEKDV